MDNHTIIAIAMMMCVVLLCRTTINDRIADFDMKFVPEQSIEIHASYR